MEAAVVIYQLFRVGRVPCKLNNDVLKILFDMNKVVVRT